MKYNTTFKHGILKVADATTNKTVLKIKWVATHAIVFETEAATSNHVRREFDATFMHYHAMLALHEFIELEDFFNDGSVTKFRNFGKKIVRSFSPEFKEVERKLRKHLDAGNPDKVAVYLTEAFSTDDPNAEFASQWKANLPPVKAVFDCQSDIFRKAVDYLKANGWKVLTVNDPDHGYQLWCLDQNSQGYHSSYDWSQDE